MQRTQGDTPEGALAREDARQARRRGAVRARGRPVAEQKRGGQRCCVGVKAGTPHAPLDSPSEPCRPWSCRARLVLSRKANRVSRRWDCGRLCCAVASDVRGPGRKSPRAQNPRTRPSHRVASPSLSGGGRGPGPGPTRPAERSRPRRRAPPPSFLAVEQQGVPPKAGHTQGAAISGGAERQKEQAKPGRSLRNSRAWGMDSPLRGAALRPARG